MIEAGNCFCEKCGRGIICKNGALSRWHQTIPVERWLCNHCATNDQAATFPKNWEGEFFPINYFHKEPMP